MDWGQDQDCILSKGGWFLVKLLGLYLDAFGPFENVSLDFSSGREGLHIVYGLNEAGKSSALRAINSFLFGIPERTKDGFRHPNKKLRLRAKLRLDDGSELNLIRKKKRKKSLLREDSGEAFDEEELRRQLHGFQLDGFARGFGLDHETLIKGGRELLEQRGDAAPTLLSTELGGLDVLALLGEIESEMDALFKERGSKPAINRALAEYKDSQGRLKKASLKASEWKRQKKELDRVLKRHAEVSRERAELSVRKNHLERMIRILPLLAKRKEVLNARAELAQVVELPEDFGKRRQEALRRKFDASEGIARCRARLKSYDEDDARDGSSKRLLNEQEEIEGLWDKYVDARTAREDRPRHDATARACKQEAKSKLSYVDSSLTLDDIKVMKPAMAKKSLIRNLAAEYGSLESSKNTIEGHLEELEDKLHKVRADSSKLGSQDEQSLVAFKAALTRARGKAEIDGEIETLEKEMRKLRKSCRSRVDRLPRWSGSIDDVKGLALPLMDGIEEAAEEQRSLKDALKRAEEDLSEKQRELDEVLTELKRIDYEGGVPTEKELEEKRLRRDETWNLVKRAWLDGEEPAPTKELPKEYERCVAEADKAVDRMRKEADKVTRKASLTASREGLGETIERLKIRRDEASGALAAFFERWKDIWKPSSVEAGSPKEMKQWLGRWQDILSKVEELSSGEASLEKLKAERRERRSELEQLLVSQGVALAEEGDLLSPRLELAEDFFAKEEKRVNERRLLLEQEKDLCRQSKRLREKIQQAVSALDVWRRDWREAIAGLPMAESTGCSEALLRLDKLEEVFAKLDEAAALRRRMYGIDERIKRFENALEEFCKEHEPELLNQSAERAVKSLKDEFQRAQSEEAARQERRKSRKKDERQLKEWSAALTTAEEELAELRAMAECKDDQGLEDAEKAYKELKSLQERQKDLEERLVEEGGGASLEETIEEARELVEDEVRAELDALNDRLQEKSGILEELSEEKGRVSLLLDEMDGREDAALEASRGRNILAGVDRLCERYVELVLSRRVLNDALERFRRENQDPLVNRGSTLFAFMTGGAFKELLSSFDDDGEGRIVGLNSRGEEIPVEAMSDGTRDQLFLALRLAAAERHVERMGSLPFIADDVLINFDDLRAKATLEALADFSKKTQVILFTHHSRVADLAKSLESDDFDVFLSQLES